MLFLHSFILILAQILSFIATVLVIVFVISAILNLALNVTCALSVSLSDSDFMLFSSKLSRVSKLSILAISILFILYMLLIPVSHVIDDKLYTGDLLNYPDSKWISEDGTVLISIGSRSEEYPDYADEGTCKIDDGQVTSEYLVIRNYNSGVKLYSNSDELRMKLYIYLLDGDSFYADMRDADSIKLFNRIIKFNRVS